MSGHTTSGNIMIVDDTPQNLRLLCDMLKSRGYSVRPAPSGKIALHAAAEDPPDLILLDINMPDMDGYEVCRRLKEDERLREIPVLFISALYEIEDKVRAFNAGGLDYVAKPFQFEEVDARVKTHLELRRLQVELKKHNLHLKALVTEQVKEISDSQMATIYALAKLAEKRDDDTGKHIDRVRAVSEALAIELRGNNEHPGVIDEKYIENLYRASPLHDVGKVGVPDAILLKPGKLTPDEFEIIKTHTVIGAETLEAVKKQYANNGFINTGIEIARSHHERWDGAGYPDGLAGEAIPLSARLVTVADVYEALRSVRCYKPAFSHEKSRDIILEGSGSQFAPSVVRAFQNAEDHLVELYESLQDE